MGQQITSILKPSSFPFKTFENEKTSTEINENGNYPSASKTSSSTSCKVTTTNDDNFYVIFNEVVEAIAAGIEPKLCQEGTSGSYFVHNKNGEPVGIFKPKDEEPFAELNPKWPKFFQKWLCFCCFDRACLIPNVGYLSETAASLVDEQLNLNVVPKTRIVKLQSSTFFYGSGIFHRNKIRPKIGSLQVFVHGFRPATEVLSEWSLHGDDAALNLEENETFLKFFHKMCILDYVIRNTDRHLDNWLIKHLPGEEISIAAIDNGLAFPVKHPESASRFRQFPFQWTDLRFAKEKLHPELRENLLNLLTPLFVHNLCENLQGLFRLDKSTNGLLSNRQIEVLLGQLYNLREGLVANESPSEWVKREPIIVTRKYRKHHTPTSNDWTECFQKKSIDYAHRGCFC